MKRCLPVFLFVSVLLSFRSAMSQTVPAKKDKEIIVTFGNSPILSGHVQKVKAKKSDLLINPKLVITSPGIPDIEVADYTFSIMPTGEDFIGPFKIQGAALRSDIVDRLTTTSSGKIFLEGIHVRMDGVIRTLNPVVFFFE